jgi:hypothetical protein
LRTGQGGQGVDFKAFSTANKTFILIGAAQHQGWRAMWGQFFTKLSTESVDEWCAAGGAPARPGTSVRQGHGVGHNR